MGPSVATTPIPGLLVLRLPVHGDSRGWVKENWQHARMTALGLPDFGPVQNNVSFNATRGVTRGIHAEPWDKLVSVASGRVYAAWVDLRAGSSFGTTFAIEVGPDTAVFVPRGVGNSYQALVDGTVYIYLVNDHYVPGGSYPALNLADETVAISWPIPLAEAEVSDKDRSSPRLSGVQPMEPRKVLILGAQGQLGRALTALYPTATSLDRGQLDLTNGAAVRAIPWHDYDVVVNCAAYTTVDEAETIAGRRIAWEVNAAAPAVLARTAAEHRLTIVHYSSDYVFDGRQLGGGYSEDDPVAPLGVYGQTKAAGDFAVATAPRHYILRTSWLVGDGNNFVRTLQRLAREGASPQVIDDQVGRLTFSDELARATQHLLTSGAPYGTYNVTNSGTPRSWSEYARRVFTQVGRSPDDITPISTEEYYVDKDGVAPRPRFSVLSLAKLTASGWVPTDADQALDAYLAKKPAR
nr:bifunctional dTDP-4-dehydrorhamnose 3,5-epimerase family protein/NAD(P)-dependent oxidoreductase [Nocardioides immobilis]